jgi:hypothetical protein
MLGAGADGGRHALQSAADDVVAATCTTLHVGHVPLMISPVDHSRHKHTQ